VDLKAEGRGDHNEYLVIFRKADAPDFPQILVKIFYYFEYSIVFKFIREWLYVLIHIMNHIVYHYIHHFGFLIGQILNWNFK